MFEERATQRELRGEGSSFSVGTLGHLLSIREECWRCSVQHKQRPKGERAGVLRDSKETRVTAGVGREGSE